MGDELNDEQRRAKAKITNHLVRFGLEAYGWHESEDGLTAEVGRWVATDDDPAGMFFVDDEGKLEAVVVGAQKYGNERVQLVFVPEGQDGGEEVSDPFEILEPLAD